MGKSKWSSSQLKGFQDAAQSLKLYRRAELPGTENEATLINSLYTDPLPQDHVLQTIVRPNTTFLIGRKGTGKSTIFQRLQREIISMKSATSAYIDVKTLYESSQVDQILIDRLVREQSGLSANEIQR